MYIRDKCLRLSCFVNRTFAINTPNWEKSIKIGMSKKIGLQVVNRTNIFNKDAAYRWYLLPIYLIYSLEELKKALPYVDRKILTCT